MRTRQTLRAACVAAALLLAAGGALALPDKAQTVSGTIAKLDAASRTLVVSTGGEEMKFVWTADTKINGVLSAGAKVTVRYSSGPDGQNLAHQISVVRG